MASKSVILLMALFAAVLVLQVAVADHDGSTTSRGVSRLGVDIGVEIGIPGVDIGIDVGSENCRRSGKTMYKGKCVNLLSDRMNCGICDNRVSFGTECCHGKSVDLNSDKENCGACGRKCTTGVNCAFGMCGYSAV